MHAESWDDVLKNGVVEFLNLAIPALVGVGTLYLRHRLFHSKRGGTSARKEEEVGDLDKRTFPPDSKTGGDES